MKVIVYMPPTLGASLLALPCLKSLQANLPEAEIYLLLSPPFEQLFSIILPEYHRLPLTETKDITRLRRAANQLKKMNFDLGFLLDHSFTSALLFYLARLPERWGYDHEGRGFMLSRKFTVKVTDPPTHLKDYYLNLLKKAGFSQESNFPGLTVSSHYLHQADKILRAHGLVTDRPIIAIKPGSSFGRACLWPVHHQIELINRLSDKSWQIILVGSTGSREVSQEILRNLKPEVVDLVGQLELADMPGILTHCRAFIGTDSGLTHLANFLGVPVVSLFGPTDPETRSPVLSPASIIKKRVPCSPCSYRACPYDHRCLNNIQPDEVYQAIKSYIKA
ncbi:MAG: lipopolysaccharide heptosyltransferase II [Acidobacteriota bacterium]|nr:lipopolysaccharide heptosyltransferase II [Acidobacteriota bacterium]